jgi:hypothetical protein
MRRMTRFLPLQDTRPTTQEVKRFAKQPKACWCAFE